MDGPLGAYLREEMAAKGTRRASRRRVRQRDATDRRQETSNRASGRSDGMYACGFRLDSWSPTRSRRLARNRSRSTATAFTRRSRAAGSMRRRTRWPAGGAVQARRGREVREPDEPHVVGLQPAGAPADVDAPAGRYPEPSWSATCAKHVRLQRRPQATVNPGRPPQARNARADVQRGRRARRSGRSLPGSMPTGRNRLGNTCWSLLTDSLQA